MHFTTLVQFFLLFYVPEKDSRYIFLFGTGTAQMYFGGCEEELYT